MASASALEQGSIIWITSTDPRGQNPKTRGFVVLTATAAIRLGEPLNRVAVTGTFREPLDKMMVPMRWNATGTTETGFTKKCFAKCDWGRVITTRKGDSGPEFDGI